MGLNAERVMAVAACLGVGVTGALGFFSYQATQRSLEQQAQQIAILSRQAFPDIVAESAAIDLWDGEDWLEKDFAGDRMAVNDWNASPYLILRLANKGVVKGNVDRVGLLTSSSREAEDLEPSRTLCVAKKGVKLEECSYPMKIEAQESVKIFISLEEETAEFTCNDFVEKEGVIAGVKLVGQDSVLEFPTDTLVPFSNDCTPIPERE